ncbi:MAG TPA: D-amino acid dehydrogenase [Gammaproteobacteria bacterium]|nr:D-amino acid dehydrogenase [Gammaproteobacteria bacterium]
MARSALVLGGGIIGTTTAWYLAERGFDVTVLERRDSVGLETSFANGGLLTPSQADPWNAPGTAIKLFKWLGREDSPLLLRPRALPGLAGWGLRFLLASRRPAYERAAETSVRLGLYSVQALDALRETLDLHYDERLVGTLKIFQSQAALDESVALGDLLARHGLRYEALTADAAAEREPALAPIRAELAGGILYPADESGDAFKFTEGMAAAARAVGVDFRFGTSVRTLRRGKDGIAAIETDHGDFSADAYVLAAGCHSRALGAACGLRLPIYPAKGYSVTVPFDGWEGAPTIPLVDFGRKLVLTPLGDRLRIAGTAEFAGYDTSLNPVRGGGILQQALDILPEFAPRVDRDKVKHWAGLRPLTPDGPPILGPTPCANLFVNAGHGPLGWTFAAGSSRIVADLVAGREPGIDLDGLRYERFR